MKYIVMMKLGSSPGSWVKAYGPTDYNTASWFASNQRKQCRVERA